MCRNKIIFVALALLSMGFLTAVLGGAFPARMGGLCVLLGFFAPIVIFIQHGNRLKAVAYAIFSMPFLPLSDFLVYGELVNYAATADYAAAMADGLVNAKVISASLVSMAAFSGGLALWPERHLAPIHVWPRIGWPIYLGAMLLNLYYWRIMPSATILTMSYGDIIESGYYASSGVFAGLPMVVQGYFAFLLVDLIAAENRREPVGAKRVIFWSNLVFYVVYLNLLRGSRSGATGICVAVFIFYLCFSAYFVGDDFVARGNRRKIFALVGVLFVLFFMIGYLRGVAADGFSFEALVSEASSFYKSGSWGGATASLYGLMSAEASGTWVRLYGDTYLSYFLSFPPSFIADFIGYARPMDNPMNDPSWWFNYGGDGMWGRFSGGGGHPAIVAFANFGMVGIAVLMFIYGALIAYVERMGSRYGYIWALVFAGFCVALPTWFWYGEMQFIRALMAVMVLVPILILSGRKC